MRTSAGPYAPSLALALALLLHGAAAGSADPADLREQALAALERGPSDEAIELIARLVAVSPEDADASWWLGTVYLERLRARSGTPGGLAEAASWFRSAGELGALEVDRTDVEGARRAFRDALALDPLRAEPRVGMALVEMRSGRVAEARDWLDRAREFGGVDPDLLLLAGNVEYLAGDLELAAGLFEQASDLRPDWFLPRKNLALVAERAGRLTEAAQSWERLLDDPELVDEARGRLEALRLAPALTGPRLSDSRTVGPLEPSRRTTRGVGGLAPVNDAPADLGRVYLRMGDLARAIAAFQAATELEPGRVAPWSDLAAALLARAERDDRPDDLVEALAAGQRAHELDPVAGNAAYNRALALDRLHLPRAALAGWQGLERAESLGADLRDAARRRVIQIERDQEARFEPRQLMEAGRDGARAIDTIVRSDRPAVVEWVEAAVFPRSGSSGAPDEAALELAGGVARSLVRVAQDHALADALDTLAAYRGAADETPLGRAVRLFFEAEADHAGDRTDAAEAAYRRMLALAPEGCRPFRARAELRVAIYDYYRSEFDAATERLQRLVETADARSYPALGGQASWMLGLIATRRTELQDGLTHYTRARDLLTRARESGRTAELDSRIADLYNAIGDRRRSWEHCHRALAGMRRSGRPRARLQALTQCGGFVRELGYPAAALAFYDEGLELAEEQGRPAEVAHALFSRARLLHDLGNDATARDDLGEAHRRLRDVPPGPFRSQLAAELDASEGQIVATTDPTLALERLEGAREYFVGAEADDRLARIHLDRGVALIALERPREALVDFESGIASFEKHRVSLASGHSITYFDRARSLFEATVGLRAEILADPAGAWTDAERFRARDLLDRLQGTPDARPRTLEEVRQSLPAGTALLAFASLEDRLLTWVVTREGIDQRVQAVPAASVNHDVTQLLAGVDPTSRTGFRPELARALYRLLIGPVESTLRAVSALIVVPDGALHRLPFAALSDPQTGRYLIETWSVTSVPSGTSLLHALQASAVVLRPAVLAIGDPSFDTRAFKELGRLPGARAEAQDIAGMYGRSTLLLGERATPQAFREQAVRHAVVHIAGHAAADLEFPELSRLALAPSGGPGDSGILTASDLYGLSLPETRLVILAACSTASGKVSRGEGALSLARPFLAAGVPSVVASLWDIDDDASAALFGAFHRHWLDGQPVAAALRSAQLGLLRSADRRLASPSAWAAIQLFGSPTLTASEAAS